jgi:hypothetical protein
MDAPDRVIESVASKLAGQVTKAIDGFPGDDEAKDEIIGAVIDKLTVARELVKSS